MEHWTKVISLSGLSLTIDQLPFEYFEYSCLLCVTLFDRLRLSADSPFSRKSWGVTA